MKVYCTRHALSGGNISVFNGRVDGFGYCLGRYKDGIPGLLAPNEWYHSYEEAVDAAEKFRAQEILKTEARLKELRGFTWSNTEEVET